MRNASRLIVASFTAVAAVAVVGCGGSSVGGSRSASTSTTTPANTTTSGLTNLAAEGVIEVTYLTGAGRGVDNVAVEISRSDFTDQQGYFVRASLPAPLSLVLGSYGGPTVIRTYVPFGASTDPTQPSTNPNSRLFQQYELDVSQLDYTTSTQTFNILASSIFTGINGSLNGTTGNDGDSTESVLGSAFVPPQYPAYIRSMPGRVTSLTVRLDPNVFGVNTAFDPTNVYGPANPRGVWEPTQFTAINLTPDNNDTFQAVLSDFMSFDISGMAANLRPTMANDGTPAGKVFFSGDNYALSDVANGGEFDELTKNPGTPSAVIAGQYSTNSTTNGYGAPPGVSLTLPGTYSLNQPDPSDTSYLRKIISLQGMFRDYSVLLNGTAKTFAVAFPGSADNSIDDLVVAHVGSAGKIIDFYYGYIDMEAQQVFLYPLINLPSASAANEKDGSITSLLTATGTQTSSAVLVRSGTFVLQSPITFAGDGATYSGGSFVVFRK